MASAWRHNSNDQRAQLFVNSLTQDAIGASFGVDSEHTALLERGEILGIAVAHLLLFLRSERPCGSVYRLLQS